MEGDGRHPEDVIPGRSSTLRKDHRTYPTSVRHEMLYQSRIFSDEDLSALIPARKARNRLVHDGIEPSSTEVLAALGVIPKLIKGAIQEEIDFGALDFDVLRESPFDRVFVPSDLSEKWLSYMDD